MPTNSKFVIKCLVNLKYLITGMNGGFKIKYVCSTSHGRTTNIRTNTLPTTFTGSTAKDWGIDEDAMRYVGAVVGSSTTAVPAMSKKGMWAVRGVTRWQVTNGKLTDPETSVGFPREAKHSPSRNSYTGSRTRLPPYQSQPVFRGSS